MTIALIAALLLTLAIIGVLALELRHVRGTYESIYQLLITDRDAAREEVKTVREALIPGLKLIQPSPTRTPVDPDLALRNSRIPTRLKAKLFTKLHNTKQAHTDALAAALPQEKKNG